MDTKMITILAVDEHRENLATLQDLLRKTFAHVVVSTAQRGLPAFERASKELPDVILLGNIPGEMDRFALCKKFKNDQKLCSIPVVFLSTVKDDKQTRLKALECGFETFLTTPFDIVELTAQIRTMVKIRALERDKHNEKIRLASLVKEKTLALQASNRRTEQLLEAAKREESLLEAIFDSIPGFLYVYDEQGKLIKWNKNHERLTGFTAEELSLMTLDKWYGKEDIQKIRSAVQGIFEKGYSEVEADLILKNGKKRLVRSSGAPLLWDGKHYFTGIGIDITEQKQVQEALLESQSILAAAFENIQAGIAIADAPDGKLRYVNKAGLLIRGTSESRIFKETAKHGYVESWKIRHLDGTPYAEDEVPLTRAVLHGETCSDEFIIRRDDSEDRYVLANATPIRDSEGKIKAAIEVFIDITERKNIEMQLQQNMEDLLASQRIAHLGTWRLDFATQKVVWSDELYNIYGFDRAVPLPLFSELTHLYSTESWQRLSKAYATIQTTGQPYELELEVLSLDGKRKWVWVSGEVIKDSEGTLTGFWGAAQDITERKNSERELLYLSNHDHLTALHNRRFFEEELRRVDTSENLPLSVIMCDINGLKLVNDSFGHDSGDALLKRAAHTIKEVCRKKDIIARIGGDEFVVVLPNTTAEETEQRIDQMKELAKKERISNVELSISFGYGTKTEKTQSIIELVAHAENYMYRHKIYERSSIRSKTIDLIMNTLFEKSSREAMHSSRVSHLCQLLATEMDFTKDGVNQMRIAGLIHDIGKIGIDETILNKPGRLSPEEREEIERHPEIGWKILSSTNEFSVLAQFVLHHHERWDGSGYPNRLKGEAILLEARIISVADAYDAMTSRRCYQESMSPESAKKELNRCSGTQFDPHIVEVFMRMELPQLGTLV